MVTSSKTKSGLNIEKLAVCLFRAIYEPEMFSGLVYKPTTNKATIIMFASGKITSTGCSSIKESINSINNTIFEIEEKLGTEIELEKINTENIVSISNVNARINLKKFNRYYPQTKYDQKVFPGAIYPIFQRIKALVFTSGKIVLVGSKSEDETKFAFEKILKMLEKAGCLK